MTKPVGDTEPVTDQDLHVKESANTISINKGN